MVKDKAIDQLLELSPRQARYYFTNAKLPRALPAAELAAAAQALGLEGDYYSDVNEAIRAAREAAQPKDLVLICGSIFIAAEVNIDLLASN